MKLTIKFIIVTTILSLILYSASAKALTEVKAEVKEEDYEVPTITRKNLVSLFY